MFFPEKMVRVSIAIEAAYRDAVLEAIGRRGVLHIDRQDVRLHHTSEEHRVRTFLNVAQKYLKLLDVPVRRERVEAFGELQHLLGETEERLAAMGAKIDTAASALGETEREHERFVKAAALEKALQPQVDTAALGGQLGYLRLRVAMVTMEGTALMRLAMMQRGVLVVEAPMFEQTNAVAFFYDAAAEEDVEGALRTVKAEEIPVRYLGREAFEAHEAQREALRSTVASLAEVYGDALRRLENRLDALASLEAAKSALREGEEGSVLLEGWMPKKAFRSFAAGLEHAKVRVAAAEGEAPVLIRTPSVLKPFETLICHFAYPRYGEINPVLPFAFAFLLLFGIMFGDVGHGLLLAAAGWGVKRYHRTYAELGQIYFLSGIASTAFGFLYGSVFGVHHLLPHLLFTPINNVQATIIFSIGIGIAIITFSFLLHIVTAIQRREPSLLFVSEGSLLWLLVYWFTIGILVKSLVQELDITYELTILTLLLAAILVLALRRSRQKTQAVIDLLREFMDTITNTISFLRVGAFALAHGALFMAVFSIARMISESHGESFGYWITLIIGNVVIIVLEAIVVTIQTLRLEYYEFFKRFFKGGGLPYRPYSVGGSDAE